MRRVGCRRVRGCKVPFVLEKAICTRPRRPTAIDGAVLFEWPARANAGEDLEATGWSPFGGLCLISRTEWDCCETEPVDEERERPHDPDGPLGGGAPPGDPDYHLHTELGGETKRLATHPREEAHRLVEELREGETETTPLIALSGMALWIAVLVAIVIALVFLIARLAS